MADFKDTRDPQARRLPIEVHAINPLGHHYALNETTGATLWIATTWSTVQSSPVVANGVIYLGSDHGKVYAFKP